MAAAFSGEPTLLHRRLSGRSAALEALVGAGASAVASVFSNPIDIVRVRLQLGGVAPPVPLHAGLGPAMAYNVRACRASAICSPALLTPASPPPRLSPQVVLNATRFSLYHASTSDAQGRAGQIGAGLLSGGVAGLLSSPLARLRTLRQAGEARSSAATLLSTGRPFAGSHIWAARNAGHTACIFGIFGAADSALGESQTGWSPAMRHLAASLVSACASCVLMNPLDVITTRCFFHSRALSGATGPPPLASRRPPASWLASAVAAGYSGLGANLLRTVPHTVITFVLAGALRNGIVHAQQQLPAATTVTHSRMRGAVSL